MIFEYQCIKCQNVLEKDFPLGKAKKTINCPKCNSECNRFWKNMNFVLNGQSGEWPSKKIKFNNEMTKQNEKAGKKMYKTWNGTQPKLIDQH